MNKLLNYVLILFFTLLSYTTVYGSHRTTAAIMRRQASTGSIDPAVAQAATRAGIPIPSVPPSPTPIPPSTLPSVGRPRSRSNPEGVSDMPRTTAFSQFETAPWMEALLRGLAERSAALSEEPYPRYPFPPMAATDPLFREAYERATLMGLHEPHFKKSAQGLERSEQEFPEAYRAYMNPYINEVINNIAHYGNRNFTENILPALEGQFVGLGQHGSTRHRELASRAARDVQEAIQRQQGQALASGFHQSAKQFQEEKLRQLEAARRHAELGRYAQAGNVADIETAARLGQAKQAEEQARLNENRAEFMRQVQYPHALLQQHAGILHGVPQQGVTAQTAYAPPAPQTQVNLPGQIGATALGLYGLQQASHKKGGRVKMKPFGLSNVAFKSHNQPKSKLKKPALLRARRP